MGENPYYHRGPVRAAAFFYDRERETARALQMVRNGQSVSVIGPRRIGKTSFLFHLSDPAVRAAHGLDPARVLFIYLNGETLAGSSSSDILPFLLESITPQTENTGLDVAHAIDHRLFERAIRDWSITGHQLVLMIDEFEYLSKDPNLSDNFYAFLRGLTLHNVAYITASEIPLLSIMDGQQLAPFFNIFTPIYLGLFSEDDARRLISEPSQKARVNFSKHLQDSILELAGPHPFFLQIACFHAFDLLSENPLFGTQVYAQLEKQVQTELESHFEYFINRLDEEHRHTLVRLLQTGQTDSSATIQSLAQQCLIRRCDGEYVLVSRVFAHFIEQHLGKTWIAGVAEGERRFATVLFADVVGFTSLTEQHIPEMILTITKRTQQIFVDVVDRHGGSVGNFGGDSVMVMFGVPAEQPDDAVRAIQAAIEIQIEVNQLAKELEQSEGIKFSARIGLDTGVVVVVEIGGEQRSEHTVLGDPVNLASRMEALAQPGTIVISEHTYKQARGRFKTESLGLQQVKGKSSLIKAYRVLEEKANGS